MDSSQKGHVSTGGYNYSPKLRCHNRNYISVLPTSEKVDLISVMTRQSKLQIRCMLSHTNLIKTLNLSEKSKKGRLSIIGHF